LQHQELNGNRVSLTCLRNNGILNQLKKCLITGPSGFIGPHVVSKLLQEDWQVLAVSRSNSLISNDKSLTYFELDLHDRFAVSSFMSIYRPSHLIHLAWEATPGTFWHSTNNFDWVSSSSFLLDSFVSNGGEKAVLAGSCAEYKWENKTLVEDQSPIEGDTYYSASKIAFKALAEVIAKDIEMVWARIFLPYGPGEAQSKLISYIVQEINNDRTPSIQSPNTALDFIYVKDVAAMLVTLLSAKSHGSINICSGNVVVPDEIVNMVAKLTNKPSLAPTSQKRISEEQITTRVQGSIERLNAVFNMKTLSSFEVGLKSYLD
jgi:nucleoside-diphosphate-sugar epimerase